MWPDQKDQNLNLKFTLLNAENLFLLFDQKPDESALSLDEAQWQKLSSSVYENKPLHKVLELKRAITEINPDILMLCEVGGEESLKNFNELFLGNQYSTALIEGNSDRHIHIGFLIRKNMPFYFDLQSNKNRAINFNYPQDLQADKPFSSLKFSRDVVELRLFKNNPDHPFLIILLSHLKSHLDPEKKDSHGFERRRAELKTLLEIQAEMQKSYPETPQIIAGDFNGNASRLQTEEEFRQIYETTALEDVLQIQEVTPDKRWTFCQVRNNQKVETKQLDYAFLTPSLISHLKAGSSYVYHYKDEYGLELDPPVTLEAKVSLPSDHYPLVFELEKLPIW